MELDASESSLSLHCDSSICFSLTENVRIFIFTKFIKNTLLKNCTPVSSSCTKWADVMQCCLFTSHCLVLIPLHMHLFFSGKYHTLQRNQQESQVVFFISEARLLYIFAWMLHIIIWIVPITQFLCDLLENEAILNKLKRIHQVSWQYVNDNEVFVRTLLRSHIKHVKLCTTIKLQDCPIASNYIWRKRM